MDDIAFDPRFTPAESVLWSVDIAPGSIATNDDIYSLIAANGQAIRRLDAQTAVLLYTLYMRGESIERISAQVDMDSATTRRRIIEGTAIIRTGDAHRVVSAVRNGQLSQKVVDSITQSGMATHDMIEALEAQAVSKLLGNFVTEDGHVASAAIDEGAILTDLRARAEKVALPQTVGSLKTLLPQIAEEYGLQRRTRSPQDTLVGPMILEWHLLKAMSDWEQIEADCEEEYAPTRDDMNAFLALCQMIAQRCPQHPDALMVDIEEAISG